MKKQKNDFTFIDLFAGIGGLRKAFEPYGTCLFSSELNEHSKKTYCENFPGSSVSGDITKINLKDIPDHDILLAGFPCQPFSLAGVSSRESRGQKHGFKDKTQGTLFFDICRILEEKQPSAFLLENVKNLRTHDKKKTFNVIINSLKELGYHVNVGLIDSGKIVPQHRERIFIVGFKAPLDFEFPELKDTKPQLKNILQKKVDEKYTLLDGTWNALQRHKKRHSEKGNGFGYSMADKNGVSNTLSARYYKDGAEILIDQGEKNPRRLTPRECARLMGFPDSFKIPVSDNQAYRQFGNAVVVPVVRKIAKAMVKCMTEGKHKIMITDYAK
jgi:DNA (cytosine-5)-methyltransferase 1